MPPAGHPNTQRPKMTEISKGDTQPEPLKPPKLPTPSKTPVLKRKRTCEGIETNTSVPHNPDIKMFKNQTEETHTTHPQRRKVMPATSDRIANTNFEATHTAPPQRRKLVSEKP